MANGKMGAPRKSPHEVIDKLCHAMKIGATIEIACHYAGISESLFYEWQQAGRNGNEEYQDFVESINNAKGKGAVIWLEKMEQLSPNWQAVAWKLERRYYKDYSANPMVRNDIELLTKKIDNLERIQGIKHEEEVDTKSD